MNTGKVKYIETLIYGRIIGLIMTLLIYKGMNEIEIQDKARGVIIQRFYKIVVSNKDIMFKVGIMTVKIINII